MDSHVTYSAPDSAGSLLRRALHANATFSGLSGLVLLLAARPVASLIGIPEPLALSIVGVLLLVYAADLVYVSLQTPVRRGLAWTAVILDALWVAGSYALLLSDWLPLTVTGRWVIFLVAEVVFVFAVVQAIGIRRMNRDG